MKGRISIPPTLGGWLIRAVLALGAVVALLGLLLLLRFTSDSTTAYSEPRQHFFYGSTGGERLTGIPYSVWMALPGIFHLPGGRYEKFGFLYEEGKALPIGVSQRRVQGIERVFFNCGICHVGSVRLRAESPPKYVAGMPSNTVDLRAFYEFLFTAAASERFSPGLVLAEIKRLQVPEDFLNQLILRFYAIDALRASLLDRRDRLGFLLEEPQFGPGRIDTFGPAKALLNFAKAQRPLTKAEGIGTTDLPSVWLQKQREHMHLHWDGNNTKVTERNRSAAFGTGAYPATLDRESMARTQAYLDTLKPEPYPDPIDRVKASRGEAVYRELCAGCHGPDGARFQAGQGALGTVTPIAKIGTDRHRLDSYTEELALNQSLLYAGTPDPSERFANFRKTYGYANMPLDGIWLRAPYLHNGSVPTLRDLLEPGAKRKKTFFRGGDLFDSVRVGFVEAAEGRGNQPPFLYDTALPGNGNQGHEGKMYGTELPALDKDALVEYLKTF